jgi:hypothetical protein
LSDRDQPIGRSQDARPGSSALKNHPRDQAGGEADEVGYQGHGHDARNITRVSEELVQ